MKKELLMSAVLLSFCLFGISAFGAAAKQQQFLVSVDWLQNHISDPDLVILHIGKQEDFDKEHIPGAQFISLSDVSTTREEDDLTLELPPLVRLKVRLERLGIGNNSRVVLYWGKDWVTPTTRVFFTLDYLDLAQNVSLLDGGMPAWVAAGNPVTAELKPPKKRRLRVKRRALVAKKAEIVDAILNNKPITIIDARDPKYYSGKEKGSMPRAGHIPNAQNIPYSTLVTEDLKFRSIGELQEIFDKAGAKKDVPVVTYCHIGQQASLAYFVARMLGYDVKIYDGSFQEWSNSEEKVIVEETDKP